MMAFNLKRALGYICLVVFVLTAAITFVIVFRPLYSLFAQATDLAESLGMTHQTLMDNYHAMLDYLTFPWVDQLVFPDFWASESGLFHFYEVKNLFYLDFVALLVSALGTYFYLRWIKRQNLYGLLVRQMRVSMIVPLVLLFFALIAFDQVFVIFHKLLFNNDAWIFDPAKDPIILALPQEFFLLCFAVVFILMMVAFYFIYRWAKSKKNAPYV